MRESSQRAKDLAVKLGHYAWEESWEEYTNIIQSYMDIERAETLKAASEACKTQRDIYEKKRLFAAGLAANGCAIVLEAEANKLNPP